MTSRRLDPKLVVCLFNLSKISGVRYFFRREWQSWAASSFRNAASNRSAVSGSTGLPWALLPRQSAASQSSILNLDKLDISTNSNFSIRSKNLDTGFMLAFANFGMIKLSCGGTVVQDLYSISDCMNTMESNKRHALILST